MHHNSNTTSFLYNLDLLCTLKSTVSFPRILKHNVAVCVYFCILIWLNLYFVFLLLSLSELNQNGSQNSLTESLLEALDEYLRIAKSIRSPLILGLMLLIWSVLLMSLKSLRVYSSSPHLFMLLFYPTSTGLAAYLCLFFSRRVESCLPLKLPLWLPKNGPCVNS